MTAQGGRVAVVTGGATGIGAVIARRLAGDGAQVAILDLDHARAAEVAAALPTEAEAFACDITDPGSVSAAIDAVEKRFGRIDVLVNNAGILRNLPFLEMGKDAWDDVVATNLTGPFLVTQAVGKLMRRDGYGRIVFVGSLASRGNAGQANYASAKAGLVGLARTVAIELGRDGVTSNVVAPGYIDTGEEGLMRQAVRQKGLDFDEYEKAVIERTTVGRLGTPGDIAEAVAFFALPGSGFVTGQTLFATGTT